MPPSFRFGLIGAGRMGRTHLRAFVGSERVAVTAIAEVSPQARRAVEAPDVVLYPSVTEMLARAAVDGILITAPSDLHVQIVAEAAARGLPILCEKPCGITTTQTRAAVRAAEAAEVPFQVAYWRRYVPALRELRERIAAGELGEVHLVACYQWDDQPPSAAFRAHSGGILIDMGVHEFDQLRWLTGQDIGALSGVASGLVPGSLGDPPYQAPDVDSAQVIAELSGGGTGLISLGRYHPAGDMARAEAFGTRGTVRCDFLDPAEGERAQLAALRRQAESFAAFAGGGPCEGATGADAIAALDAAERAGAAIPALARAGARNAAGPGGRRSLGGAGSPGGAGGAGGPAA
jgi:myo-inositol 2-dehydrogenase / D-chiro-inositol 1-dehydrogenase